MKAVTYEHPGGPEVLRCVDLADPAPGAEELLVRVEAISIEGGDLLARRSFDPPSPAHVPGYAASGEVVATGAAVEGFAVGDKVTTFAFQGSHAELRAVPAATSWLLPKGMDLKAAAAIPCGPGTAAHALDLGGLQAGQTVLVLGAAGGVGVAAVQLASMAGARVIGVGTNAGALSALAEYGLTDAIVAADAPVSEQVRQRLAGEGVDLLIDNVGGRALEDALRAVKDGGRAVLVGVVGGFDAKIQASDLLGHRKTVIGCLLGVVMAEPSVRRLIARLIDQVAAGDLVVPIDSVFRLSDIAAAHARAEERGRVGRVIVTP